MVCFYYWSGGMVKPCFILKIKDSERVLQLIVVVVGVVVIVAGSKPGAVHSFAFGRVVRFDQIREQTRDVRGVRCGVMKSIIGKRPHGRCEDAKQGTSSAGAGGEHQFKRQFAHVEGNWPSHIYFAIAKKPELVMYAQSCVEQFKKNRDVTEKSSSGVSVGLPALKLVQDDHDHFHVSLSRPFVLRHHQIQPFLRILHKSLLTCPVLPITCEVYAEYVVLTNDTKTRSFISIPLEDRLKALETVVTTGIDVALKEMRQPLYYTNPKFHISVASFASIKDPVAEEKIATTLPSSCNGSEASTESEGQVCSVEKNVVSLVRQDMKASNIFEEGDSDSDESECSEDSESQSTEQYCGSTILLLENIECKIGNKKYRFHMSKGFLEC